MSLRLKEYLPLLAVPCLTFLWACGSGSTSINSGTDSAPSPIPLPSVGISPSAVSVLTGGTQQFTATVQNTPNTGVTWSVDGVPNGNSTVGTTTGTGSTVTYTAPKISGLHTVTATSVADTTQTASATVTVTPVKISISPTTASLLVNGARQFIATIQNTSNTGVSWIVNGILNGSPSVGTISGTGTTVTYTAPASAGSYTVTATSLADTTQSASATVTVTAPGVTVTITPAKASIAPAATQQFTATVQNTSNTDVSWTVNGILNGDPSVGTISGTGNTATYTAPTTTGTYTVSATSLADTSKSVSAAVNVTTNPFPTSRHVFVVIEENQSFSHVFPSGSAINCSSAGMPYLCSLAAANGLALNLYANVHGSLEDYLYMTSGATWTASPHYCNGNSCASTGVITGDNLVRALTNAGLTWRGYFEGMPAQGYMGGDSGAYYIRHNPFPWYSDVATSVSQQANMYPFTEFATDVQANNFQNFNLIVPNARNDADDPATTSPGVLLATADHWLQTNIAPLLSTPPFQPGGDGILIVLFDEGNVAGESGNTTSDGSCSPTQSSGCGGHVAFVMIGPNVLPGSTTTNTCHFQDMLYTIIHLLGMADFMNSAAAGTDIALLPGT